MPNVAVPTWPPGAPPLLPTPQSLVPWLVAVPLFALLAVLLAARLRSQRAASIAAAPLFAGAGLVSVGGLLLARLAPGRVLVSPSGAWLASGGLVLRSTVVLDPLRVVLLLAVFVAGAAAVLGARTRAARTSAALVTLGGVVAASADDWVVAVAGFALGGFASLVSERPGSAGRVISSQVSALLLVTAGVLFYWSQGASGFGDNGVPRFDAKLARLWGADAVVELVARPGTSVPVGVEESLALGDRAATGAAWLPSDPSLSWRVVRDLVAAETTGMRAHLAAATVKGVSTTLFFLVLAAAAVVWRARAGVLAALGGVVLLVPTAPLVAVVPESSTVLGVGGALVALVAGWLTARRDGLDGTRSLAVVHAGLAVAALGVGGPASAALHAVALATAILGKTLATADGRVSRFVALAACGPLPSIALLARAETAGRAFMAGELLVAGLCAATILVVGRSARTQATTSSRVATQLGLLSLACGALAQPLGGRSALGTLVAASTTLPDRVAPAAAPWWSFAGAIVLAFAGYFLPIRRLSSAPAVHEPPAGSMRGVGAFAWLDRIVDGSVGFAAGLVRFAANLASGLEAGLLEWPARRVTTFLRRRLRRSPTDG